MRVSAYIPARFGSTRFPGKPLARDTGKYLIQHVYEAVRRARRIDSCVVCTDDERILVAVRSFGGEAVMTRSDHASGTDRIAEAVSRASSSPPDVVLNVQGDEPEIDPAHLDRLVERLESSPGCEVATLASAFPSDADPSDPNCVKVVLRRDGNALYFSRARIPYRRDANTAIDAPPYLLHLGVYAYRREFLLEMASWPAARLEEIERLEQLRVLEHGRSIAVVTVSHAAPGIDTEPEYRAFVERCTRRG